MSGNIEFKRLAEPFQPDDIEWRIQQVGMGKNGPWGKCLAYVTNRAIMERLDSVCGPENWKNEYHQGPLGGILCGLSIKISGEWVTKYDGADNTKVESIKGGLSSAMKRAAVQWGIGRYLYKLDEGWVNVSPNGKNYQPANQKKNTPAFKWDPPALPPFAVPQKRISEKQKRMLEAIIRKYDFDREKVKAWLQKNYGATHFQDIITHSFDSILSSLEAWGIKKLESEALKEADKKERGNE